MRAVFLTIIALFIASSCFADSDTVAIQTIVLEAQGESLEGQIAVGEVIRNRAITGDLSHEAVCLAPSQFSCWNDRPGALKRLKRVSGDVWQTASKAWELSKESNSTHGSTHYHHVDIKPYWAAGHRPAVIIGKHAFYNDIK